MTAAMIAVPIADTVQMKRLTEFAADVLELADERADLELREPVNEPHSDLLLRRRDQAGRQPRSRSRGARPNGGVEAGAGY
jgi:hypothetical protein